MSTSKRILLIEDSEDLGRSLLRLLKAEGYQPTLITQAEDAPDKLDFDLIISDLKLPGISGIDFLRNIQAKRNAPPAILMTAFGTIDLAVEAMKLGATEFITKPFEPKRLLSLVAHITERSSSDPQGTYVRESEIITEDPGLLNVIEQTKKVAPLDCPVMVLGESGTGKELVARLIHSHSSRVGNPYIAINCASMPHDLLESEFFGHEAGAFTGATTKRIGLFEEASSGSLFLDEIGTMPVSLQGKLLRAIQDSEIRAVGSNEYKPIDVRIISATNSNLKESIEDKTFRDDLYYRLGVVILEVPPLRRRKDDIPLLIEHFAKRFAEKFNIPTPKLNSSLVKNLKNYPWPGNVRELENAVERALVLSEGPLSVDAFELSAAPEALLDEDELPSLHDAVSDAVKRTERELIQRALARTGGNKVKASKALGVSYKTLINKSKEYQLAQKAKPHAQDKLH